MTHMFNRWAAVVCALAAVLVAGCGEATGPSGGREATLRVSASVAGTPVSTLVVEVTAADITTPLVFNIEIVNGVASGTITILAGSNRRITVRGFDAYGVETHRGSATVTVRPGPNPSVSITLDPLRGDQPIVVTLSGVVVTVSPQVWALGRGQTVQLQASVTDAQGNPIAAVVSWGSANPARATVSSSGLVTAGPSHGPVEIVATYGGVGAAATIEVLAPLSAGARHTCGITAGGAAYCWGWNSGGQLGDGSTVDHNTPVPVSGSLTFTSISAGDWQGTCGVTTGGAAYCWGEGGYGQLGDGSNVNRSTPGPVSGELSFASISVGGFHACGVTTDGAAYCWGANTAGQLGDGSNLDRDNPGAVSGELSFASISAGYGHTCGVTTGGAAYCWGWNSAGQLGDGSTVDHNTPVPVSGSLTFTSISAGDWQGTCGVTTGGAAYCWGEGGYGQLGDGSNVNRSTPGPVSGELSFASITAGGFHACGVTTGDAAYCWGLNSNGRLGDGSTTDHNTPVAVLGVTFFTSVSAGRGYTCGVTPGGEPYCWGANTYGQLGDGSTIDRLTPVLVRGGLTFP